MTNQELFDLIKKHKALTASIMIGVFSVAWLIYRSGDLETYSADLGTKTTQADRLRVNIEYGANLTEHIANAKQLNLDLQQRCLHVSALAQNLDYFYSLEAKTGVKSEVKQLQVTSNPKSKQTYVILPFSVNLQGSYAQVMMFLRLLEQNTYFCRITSYSLKPVTVSTGVDGALTTVSSINLSLTLEFLSLPD